MKSLLKLLCILLLINSQEIYSQEFIKLPNTQKETPFYIFNENIIGNLKIIDSTKTNLIKYIKVIKHTKQPIGHKNIYPNLSEFGLIYINIDFKISYKKQSELNSFFGLAIDTPIYVDGYLIKNTEYNVSTESIVEIEKVPPNTSNHLKTTVLNIWTLNKNDRKGSNTKCGGIKINK